MTKKELIEKLIERNEIALMEAEIDERYLQRKIISGQKKFESLLAQQQSRIREIKDYLDFLREILKEEK